MSSGFIRVETGARISFQSEAEWYSIICVDQILIIPSSVGGHFGYFCHLAALSVGEQVSVLSLCLQFLWVYTPKWNC